MVDWNKRLANESPLFRDIFKEIGAKSVLDAACGTGRHAGLFASWGLQVEAADASEEMVAYCREAFGAIANISFAHRSFTEPASLQFDAVVCVGNSLSLVSDLDQVRAAVAAMAKSLSPSGVLILQVMNLLSREDGSLKWDKTIRRRLAGHDTVVVKGTRRQGRDGFVEALLINLDTDPPTLQADTSRLVAIDEQTIRQACEAANLSVECFGDYQKGAYHDRSRDLIAIARRKQTLP